MKSHSPNIDPAELPERPDSPAEASAEAALAARLFAFLEQRGVAYVVVGDVRAYDRAVTSDIDLVVAEEVLPLMPQVLADFAAANGGRLVQVIRHEREAFAIDIAFTASLERVYLHPDVCADFVRSGRLLVCGSELLAGRSRTHFGAFVPAPGPAFGYFLAKKIDKGSIRLQALEYLVGLWQTDRASCLVQVERLLGSGKSQVLTQVLDQTDLDAFNAVIGGLRRSMHRARQVRWFERLAELRHALHRWSHPTGFWVAFYGPDGAGKSSVIGRVEARLAPAFRRTAKYHLRPHFGRRSSVGGSSVTEPHGRAARGLPASLLKAAYWFLDASVGYWLRIRPQLVRSTLVVFDRYVDDLGVDPKRYRFGAPAWLAEALRRLTPRPDMTVVLDAPGELLQARKAEVPLVESERQRTEYRVLAARTRGAVVLDAARPLPEVVNAVEAAVLDRLEERTARRLGLA